MAATASWPPPPSLSANSQPTDGREATQLTGAERAAAGRARQRARRPLDSPRVCSDCGRPPYGLALQPSLVAYRAQAGGDIISWPPPQPN